MDHNLGGTYILAFPFFTSALVADAKESTEFQEGGLDEVSCSAAELVIVAEV